MKLVWDKTPTKTNARNSEGSFIRLPDNSIFFAYSRYCSDDYEDGGACDIAVIRSYDEGNSWTDPEIIVNAKEDFAVQNVMSVSCLWQKDGALGVYFLVKEKTGNSVIGRALSYDFKTFTKERCVTGKYENYYVINNDRFIRLSDGRLAAPAAMHGNGGFERFSVTVILMSEDDGKTFLPTPLRLTVSATDSKGVGMQEPGIYEHDDGTVRIWARTKLGAQYECFSRDLCQSCTSPMPSPVFTGPSSPLEMIKNEADNSIYAVYNPVPMYKDSKEYGASWGRTPLVVRKSADDGKTWGPMTVIEDGEDRGYCYPAMIFTKDNAMLCAYCRGTADDGYCLSRLGIMKISLDEIK